MNTIMMVVLKVLFSYGLSLSYILIHSVIFRNGPVRPEKFQFMEKWQNRNFGYKIVISVKNPKFIL